MAIGNFKYTTTPLMYACQQGDVRTVLRLLSEKPHLLRLRDRKGKSALHYSCGRESGFAIASRNNNNNSGQGTLNMTQTADIISRAAPDLVDSRDSEGFTPLHLAVIGGNLQLVTFLLASGADVNAVDNEHHSVVHWATVCGELSALRSVLSAGAPVSTPDVHGGYPLHYAAQICGGDKLDREIGVQVLQTLLAQSDISTSVTDADGRNPLLWAASAGSVQAILTLLKSGALLQSADQDGLTALHYAASRGHTDVLDVLITFCGAEIDVIDCNGCTALHYAVTLGHADATALLLGHGSNPNQQDRRGRSPAHCGCAKGQFETVRILNDVGKANLWLRNARGDFPLHEATASGRRNLVIWLLEQRPVQINARNNDGRCALHLAAINDNADMCKVLLSNGAIINPVLRTSKNILMTPMDCAMQRGNRATAKYLQAHGGLPANRINNQEIVVEKSLLPENKIDSADEDYGEVTESNRKIAKNKKSKHKNADPSSKIVRVKKSLIPAELDKRSKSSCLANQSEKQSVTIPKENHKSHKGSKSAHNLKGESIKTTTCPPKIQGIAHIPSIETLAISIEENAKTIQNKITTLKIQNEDIQVKSVCKSEAVALIEGQLIDKIEVMHGLLTKLESQKEHEIRVDLTAISSLNDEIKTMRNDLKSVEEQVDMKLNKQIDIIRKELATLRTNYNLDDAPTEVRDDLIKEQQSELLSQLQNESELKSIPHIEKIADEIIIDDSSVVNVEHLVEDNLEILTPTSQSDKIGILSEKIPSDSKLEDFLSIHKQSDDEGIVPEIEKFDEVDIDKKYIGMESNIDDTIQLQSTEKYISEIQHNDDLGDQTNATADHTDKADETIYDIPEQYQKELEPCTELITQDHEEDRNYKSFTVINKRRKSAEENNKEKRSRSEESIQPKQSKIPLAVRNNKRWSSSKLIGAHERKLKSSTTNLTAASNHSLSTPINLNVLSDDIMNSETDNDEENNEYYSKSFHDRKRLVKRRFKPRSPSFNLHQSDYDSNVIDSGIEPSPRCVQRTCKDNVTSRSVNMVSVTQSLQSNIRRYHLERGIFQHLLDLKRLQIRSGKNNEQVMVKRAIDSFHRTCGSLPGMSRFKGTDYSFKIFEKFLYGILRKLQYPEDGYKKFSGLPNFPEDPLTCTRNTWRCSHATHAYTGIPCAAYLPAINHHTIPKIGFNKSSKQTHLPNIGESLNTSENVTLELSHGNNKQKISLPTERLDESKRYYVTFTVKDDEK